MNDALTVGSLFSGIGGLDLGLERAGMQVKWNCEIDPYCREVLAHHWPGVKQYDDIRDVDASAERVDLICGGFPCQPVSLAGRGLAQADPRWLWPEFKRVVGELRPRYVLVENVPGLATRGLGLVVGDLSALGYDAEWQVVSAASVGAPHIRERIFVVAYPCGERRQQDAGRSHGNETQDAGGARKKITSLTVMVKAIEQDKFREMWPTATATANMHTGPGSSGREGGLNLQTAVGGSLNPRWVEWLMGFPVGWTDLSSSETP